MIDAHVGRLLAATLHEAIGDELPQRLEFYEEWLRGQGMRDGTIGLAPITAVLSFLRAEGEGYDRVVARAGTLAADWSVAALSPVRRRMIAALPRPLRARAALSVARGIARDVCSVTRANARVSRGKATIAVRESVFCFTREPQTRPLCGFYAALSAETLRQLGLPAEGRAESCRASGASACSLIIEFQ
jgi:predicted hydrocarbon binding protein